MVPRALQGVSGAFHASSKGFQGRFKGYQEVLVSVAFKEISGSSLVVSGGFRGLQGPLAHFKRSQGFPGGLMDIYAEYQEISGTFQRVPGGFRESHDNSRAFEGSLISGGLRGLQGPSETLQWVLGVPWMF